MKVGEEVTVDLGETQVRATVIGVSAGIASPNHPSRVMFPGAVVVKFAEPLETPFGAFKEAAVWPFQCQRKPGRKPKEKEKDFE